VSDVPPWTSDLELDIRAGGGTDPLLHGPGLLHAIAVARTIAANPSIETEAQLDEIRPQLLEHVLEGDNHYAEAIKRLPWRWIEWIRAHPDVDIPAE
jgi:hypothetical protein